MKGVAPADVPLNFLAKAIRAEKAGAFSKRQVFPYNLPTFSEEETRTWSLEAFPGSRAWATSPRGARYHVSA
jgi:hypothetical protein